MMKQDKVSEAIAAFEQHLDVYGGHVERWPETSRKRFEPLVADEPRARALLAEARALDRLLDRPPAVDGTRLAALGDRIVSVAENERRTAGSVVELSQVRRSRTVIRTPGHAAGWRVVSALAASLVLGIYLGAAPDVVSAVETIADSVGITESADADSLAFFDDDGPGGSEDLL